MKSLSSKHLLALLATSIYCSTSTIASETVTNPNDLTGFWKSQGMGLLLAIGDDHYRQYDITGISCIQTDQGGSDDFLSEDDSIRLSTDQQQLTFTLPGTVIDTRFSRLATLPDPCADGGMQPNHDPELNFEVFWHTFSENYPAFSKRGVNWQQLYQQYRPQVNAQTSDAALLALFGKMIDPLEDGHIEVSDTEGNSISSVTQGALQRNLQREFEQQHLLDDQQQYNSQAIAQHFSTLQNNYLKGQITAGTLNDMFWGMTADGFGYLYLGNFKSAETDNDNADSTQTIAALRTSMATFIDDIKDAKGLIIDLRFNPGGNDAMAFEIATFFNDQKKPVFNVQSALPGQQLSTAATAYLPVATGARYQGPIALLTSRKTGSAAEIFTLAMRELPHVTLVGTQTGGDLSNRIDKQLPNGWTFSVAPDIYRSQDGRVFEAEGIPPNANVPFFSRTDRVLGIDSAIETAQQLLTLDKIVMESMNHADIPALSASLVVNGETVFSKGYGFADKELQRRATADTPFGIGSISKTVIGVAIMQLVEQGRLSLDTPINNVLPFTIDNPKVDAEIITIRHLVSHTSGLIDNADEYDDSYVLEAEAVPALGVMLQNYYLPNGEFYHAQLNFAATQPGEQYQYSNIAAALAAYVVEVITQQSFDQYVQQRIFQPLNMNHSHYHLAQFPANTVAIPYGVDNQAQFYHYPTYPDGLLRTSANDLAAYMIDLTTGKQLLSQASIAQLWTPLFPQTSGAKEGVFWDITAPNNDTDVRLVSHNGSDPGVEAELYIIPDLAIGAVAIINKDQDETEQGIEANKTLTQTINQLLALGTERAVSQLNVRHASGAWYDPSTDGQGFYIEILPDNQAVVIWFGYDAQGQQRWIIGAGRVVDNRIDIAHAYQTTGGLFGANFDPATVQRKPWGELVFEFITEDNGETTATLVYNSLEAPKHGEITLTRLTRNYQPEPLVKTRNMTGTWFDPNHNGKGFILQELNKTEAVLYWFTYTSSGDQAWLVGKGSIDGDILNFPDMQITSVAPSGSGSNTAPVNRQKWGNVRLTVKSCQQLDARYQGLPGSGELTLERLTTPVAVECQ